MPYYCKNENIVFYDDLIKNCSYDYHTDESFNCLNPMCCEELIEIDENIIQTIVILNKKGYITSGSCSGHFGFLNETYIYFKANYNFETLPKGFIINDYRCYVSEIHKDFDYKDYGTIKRQNEIWETAKDLLEWAEALPDNKSGEFTRIKQIAA
jgi:hypothetical protein